MIWRILRADHVRTEFEKKVKLDDVEYNVADEFCYLGGMLRWWCRNKVHISCEIRLEDIQGAPTLINVSSVQLYD